jgi:hypothetical protein
MRRSIPRRATVIPAVIAALLLICAAAGDGEPVAVRYPQGVLHGFLVLRTADGKRIADGDLMQTVDGDVVTSHLVFHFTDGSLQDETTRFSQQGTFRVISDHLVQQGPIFPEPLDLFIDGRSGRVEVRYSEHGQPRTATKRMVPPADLSNGIIPVLLENARGDHLPKSFSLIVATPEPRLVTLELSKGAPEELATGAERHRAIQYVIKVHIGGLAGFLAPLAGKQPPDSHVWILAGEAPTFLKASEPFYASGPLWTIELVSPTRPGGRREAME